MHSIPPKIRERLAADPFMKRCIQHSTECDSRIEWEHAFIYSGKQMQEWWAIVPCCTHHHRGPALNKEFNQYIALQRAAKAGELPFVCKNYPKVNWVQKLKYLENKFRFKK